MSQISRPVSPYADGDFKNTIFEPSGDTDAAQPSSLNFRGAPTRMESVQSSNLFSGGVAHDANSCELSGNQPSDVTSCPLDNSGCISPVVMSRRYIPDLSAYARYFPSGEIADAETAFSLEFVVRRCCVGADRGDFAGAVRKRNHPAATPATTIAASAAIANSLFLGGVATFCAVATCVVNFPDSVSRLSRLRSARNSAADWQRTSRSFSSVLLMTSSSLAGTAG